MIGGYLYLFNNESNRRELYKIEGIEQKTNLYLAYNKDRKLVYGSEKAVRAVQAEGYFIPSGQQVPVKWLVPQQLQPHRQPSRKWRRLISSILSRLTFRSRRKSTILPA